MKSSCSPGAGPRFGPATSRCTGDADASGSGNGGVRRGGRYATSGEQGVTKPGGDREAMVLTNRNTGGGRAGQFLRCNAAYRTAWRCRHPQPGLPKQAPFQVRLQTVADLAASRWGLLAWADPDEEDRPIPPFWIGAPMLETTISPDATPLVPGMTALAAPLSGLRLVDSDLVLKIERGRATTQLRIPADSGLGPADGVLAQHDILLSPVAFSSQLREAPGLPSRSSWCVGARTSVTMPRPGTASGSE